MSPFRYVGVLNAEPQNTNILGEPNETDNEESDFAAEATDEDEYLSDHCASSTIVNHKRKEVSKQDIRNIQAEVLLAKKEMLHSEKEKLDCEKEVWMLKKRKLQRKLA